MHAVKSLVERSTPSKNRVDRGTRRDSSLLRRKSRPSLVGDRSSSLWTPSSRAPGDGIRNSRTATKTESVRGTLVSRPIATWHGPAGEGIKKRPPQRTLLTLPQTTLRDYGLVLVVVVSF